MFGTQSHVLSGQMPTEIPAMVESLNQKDSEQFVPVNVQWCVPYHFQISQGFWKRHLWLLL